MIGAGGRRQVQGGGEALPPGLAVPRNVTVMIA